jgi:ABC-2 type transport system ATP-binding protein
MDDRPHRVRVAADRARELAAALLARGLIDGVSVTAEELVVHTNDVDRFGRSIAPTARELGVRLREVEPLDDDLESVFRYLVERR